MPVVDREPSPALAGIRPASVLLQTVLLVGVVFVVNDAFRALVFEDDAPIVVLAMMSLWLAALLCLVHLLANVFMRRDATNDRSGADGLD
jgi:hypothetical protein